MQTDTADRKSPSPAAIVGIVGGALLAIGSFLTWVTVTLDTAALATKLADLLGVDPSIVQGQLGGAGFSESATGLSDSADGVFTLIAGIVAIVVALVILLKVDLRKPMAIVLILAGVVGGGVAVYDMTTVNNQKDQALSAMSSQLGALGIDSGTLGDVIKVSFGIGIWVCAIGGLIAIVGGVMALVSKSSAAPAMAGGTAAPMGSGFDAPAPAAPAAPPAPAAPAAPIASEPTAPMPPADAAPAAMPDAAPDVTPAAMPDAAPEPAPDAMPDVPGDDQGSTTT